MDHRVAVPTSPKTNPALPETGAAPRHGLISLEHIRIGTVFPCADIDTIVGSLRSVRENAVPKGGAA